MNNLYFQAALAAAGRMIGRPARVIRLAAQCLQAVRPHSLRQLTQAFRQNLGDLGRLLIAYGTRQYTAIPIQSLVAVTAALLYFTNPLDLIPDALPALGLTDDFAVLSWVARSLSAELSDFRHWELHQATVARN